MARTSTQVLRIALAASFLLTAAFVAQPNTTLAGQATVQVGDIWFCDESFEAGVCETTINIGETVVWDFDGSDLPHTTTECGASCDAPTESPIWDSGLIGDGSTFEYTFSEPGTFLYYCEVHPTLQRGIIMVQGPPTSTTVPPTATSAPPSPTPAGVIGDVDCDGSIDSIDAALVLQLTAGLVGSLSCEENADANEDGRVDSIDAALILQLTAGLLANLPP